MNRSVSTVLAQLLAVASIGVAIGAVTFGMPDTPDTRPMPPCAAEDGGPYPCVWDGPNRGNRQGDRVVITGAP